MVDVGYFPGARGYFKRAADAGSAEAALSVGTYDPVFIEEIGAQGIKPDVARRGSGTSGRKRLATRTPRHSSPSSPRRKRLGIPSGEPGEPPTNSASRRDARTATQRQSQQWTTEAGRCPGGARSKPDRRDRSGMGGNFEPGQCAVSADAAIGDHQSRRTRESIPSHGTAGKLGAGYRSETSEIGWVYARYVAAAEAPPNR